MTEIPRKIKQVYTQACIQVERAYTPLELADVLIFKASIRTYGDYEYPEWLELILAWKREDPVRSTEEVFRKKYLRKHDHDYMEPAVFRNKLLKPYSTSEMLLIWKAIQEVYDDVRVEAFKQALWGIATQILGWGIPCEAGLHDEWHRTIVNEYRGLEHSGNYRAFKALLKRESLFWTEPERIITGHLAGGGGLKQALGANLSTRAI